MKTIDELRKLDEHKLRLEKSETEKALFKVSFEVKSGQSKNIHHVGRQRKQVARIETIIKEKQAVKETNPITKDNEI